jgi:membrane-associated phospholipid phosphatase
VGATVAIAIAIGRIHRVAGWLLGLLAVGVAAGAVYGGFHYALDVAIGAALGILVAIASPHLHARLERAVRGRPAAVP